MSNDIDEDGIATGIYDDIIEEWDHLDYEDWDRVVRRLRELLDMDIQAHAEVNQ